MKKYYSEVKLCTDKKGIIQLINTLLNNLGAYRNLSIEDSDKQISEMLEFINSRFSFNILHFVNWENCKGTRLLNSAIMKKRHNDIAKFIRLVQVKDMYYLEFVIDCVENEVVNVAAQYSDTTWVVDNYFNEEKVFVSAQTLTNLNGKLNIQEFSKNEVNELCSLYPIHYGYVEVLSMYDDMFKIECLLKDKIQKSIFDNILTQLKSDFETMQQNWKEYKNKILNENMDSYIKVDLFAPFYFTNTENSELIIWSLNDSGDYSISNCFTNRTKNINKTAKKDNEIVVLPLWN